MTALAYYMAAVREREREHMPLIGPSVDRRTLALVNRAANSDTVCSLMCFVCAQLHTWVASWETLQPPHRRNPLLKGQRSQIAYHNVKDTLLRLEAEDVDSFLLSCSLEHFRRRFASERGSRSNPLRRGVARRVVRTAAPVADTTEGTACRAALLPRRR